jgi:hypothetical protein
VVTHWGAGWGFFSLAREAEGIFLFIGKTSFDDGGEIF